MKLPEDWGPGNFITILGLLSILAGCSGDRNGNEQSDGSKTASNGQITAPPRPGLKHSANRTALVMCVSDYGKADFLSLPGVEKDKDLMRETLETCGFRPTQTVHCPGLEEANRAIADFLRLLEERGGTGLFYFSGHGTVWGGKQYLLLGDRPIGDPSELDSRALVAGDILRRMEDTGTETNVMLLDCCRSPYVRGGYPFAPSKIRAGSFCGYATGDGNVAIPGPEGSPYTLLLCRYLRIPGTTLSLAHMMVQRDFAENVPGIAPNHRNALSRGPLVLNRGPERTLELVSGDSRLFAGIPFIWCPSTKPGQGFWISQTEITRSQWHEVMGGALGAEELFLAGRLPVRRVSWNDALAFCHELNAGFANELPAGRAFNLPTGAEWEYACRAGTQTDYFFGNDTGTLHRYAHFSGETSDDPEVMRKFRIDQVMGTGLGSFEDQLLEQQRQFEQTLKDRGLIGVLGGDRPDLPPGRGPRFVRVHLPNPWAIHDMLGNVAEWILDQPENTLLPDSREVRGGSYLSHALHCRPDSRITNRRRSERYNDVGFRIVIGTHAVPPVPAFPGTGETEKRRSPRETGWERLEKARAAEESGSSPEKEDSANENPVRWRATKSGGEPPKTRRAYPEFDPGKTGPTWKIESETPPPPPPGATDFDRKKEEEAWKRYREHLETREKADTDD